MMGTIASSVPRLAITIDRYVFPQRSLRMIAD